MKYRINIYNIVGMAALLFGLCGCESGVEITEPTTDLVVHVYNQDDEPKPIAGAVVALYDNYDNFREDSIAFSTSKAMPGRVLYTDAEGMVRFDSLAPKVTTSRDSKNGYWINSLIVDSTTYGPSAKIFQDNGASGYELVRGLIKSSETYVDLFLTPAQALVTFYASSTSSGTYPISLRLGVDSIGTLKNAAADSNKHFASGTITKLVRRGTYPYFAQNAIGCTLLKNLVIEGGEQDLFIPTSDCTSGSVVFWTQEANRKSFPLKVTFNGDTTTIGRLASFRASAPKNCESGNAFRFNLEPGQYTYQIQGLNSKCIWSGTLNIVSGTCTVIELERCTLN